MVGGKSAKRGRMLLESVRMGTWISGLEVAHHHSLLRYIERICSNE